ncbi:ETS translocation variant 2 isoform X2 [Pipistrellus kuhlii]|uniref:ETS translocation variant 2 isoform X2 n=1 Tax=Pipistrellus kuhlii TaxID=59472 RepID=UPI001E274D6C|nr:ETS translocation variant 2 isoform X2 [Pipistrellus kuhlii]
MDLWKWDEASPQGVSLGNRLSRLEGAELGFCFPEVALQEDTLTEETCWKGLPQQDWSSASPHPETPWGAGECTGGTGKDWGLPPWLKFSFPGFLRENGDRTGDASFSWPGPDPGARELPREPGSRTPGLPSFRSVPPRRARLAGSVVVRRATAGAHRLGRVEPSVAGAGPRPLRRVSRARGPALRRLRRLRRRDPLVVAGPRPRPLPRPGRSGRLGRRHVLVPGPRRRPLFREGPWGRGLPRLLGLGAARGPHRLSRGVPGFRSHHLLRTRNAAAGGPRNAGLLSQNEPPRSHSAVAVPPGAAPGPGA